MFTVEMSLRRKVQSGIVACLKKNKNSSQYLHIDLDHHLQAWVYL